MLMQQHWLLAKRRLAMCRVAECLQQTICRVQPFSHQTSYLWLLNVVLQCTCQTKTAGPEEGGDGAYCCISTSKVVVSHTSQQ